MQVVGKHKNGGFEMLGVRLGGLWGSDDRQMQLMQLCIDGKRVCALLQSLELFGSEIVQAMAYL